MQLLHSASVFLASSVGAFVLLAGCQREIELTYVSSKETQELPDEDQANIRLLLTKSYGTPSDPALRLLGGRR